MKIVSHSKAYYMALDKIPQVVAELRSYYSKNEDVLFRETVAEYSTSGFMYSKSDFVVTADDVMDHIKRSKKNGFIVEMNGDNVVISKDRSDGTRLVATYSAIAA